MKIKFINITLLLCLALFLVGCNDTTTTTEITNKKPNPANTDDKAKDDEKKDDDKAKASVPNAIEPGDIAADPEKYIGKEVTVVGEVEKVMGPLMFTLDEEALTGTKDVLVLSPKKPDLDLEEIDDSWLNDGVIVKGTVKRLVKTEIEKELTWDLDTKIVAEYTDRPILIASSIVKR